MIRIYGASDDLIEVEGDIREEFPANYDEDTWLALSDGTILQATYNGDWVFSVIVEGTAKASVRPWRDGDKSPDYSQVVEIVGFVRWVAFCERKPAIKVRGQ